MGCSREKRPSEKTLDTVFHLVRSLDIEVWRGEKYGVEDVEENVAHIKRYLDEMVTQFKTEVKYVEPPKKECSCGCGDTVMTQPEMLNKFGSLLSNKPFPEPPLKKPEWQTTPIVPPAEGTK